jgi:hypothetical protein
MCADCRRVTPHYGRRMTTSTETGSDRSTGEVVWFCGTCGHRVQAPEEAAEGAPARDDLTNLSDRQETEPRTRP